MAPTSEQRSELVFIHDYSHTTNLWPRRSVVSPDKPLFVKDLPRLWAHTYDRVSTMPSLPPSLGLTPSPAVLACTGTVWRGRDPAAR